MAVVLVMASEALDTTNVPPDTVKPPLKLLVFCARVSVPLPALINLMEPLMLPWKIPPVALLLPMVSVDTLVRLFKNFSAGAAQIADAQINSVQVHRAIAQRRRIAERQRTANVAERPATAQTNRMRRVNDRAAGVSIEARNDQRAACLPGTSLHPQESRAADKRGNCELISLRI